MAFHGDGYPLYPDSPPGAGGPYNAGRINANAPPMPEPAPENLADRRQIEESLAEALAETTSSF